MNLKTVTGTFKNTSTVTSLFLFFVFRAWEFSFRMKKELLKIISIRNLRFDFKKLKFENEDNGLCKR